MITRHVQAEQQSGTLHATEPNGLVGSQSATAVIRTWVSARLHTPSGISPDRSLLLSWSSSSFLSRPRVVGIWPVKSSGGGETVGALSFCVFSVNERCEKTLTGAQV